MRWGGTDAAKARVRLHVCWRRRCLGRGGDTHDVLPLTPLAKPYQTLAAVLEKGLVNA